jgi:hypothetical protein
VRALILDDHRHRNIRLLLSVETRERLFADSALGFELLDADELALVAARTDAADH